MLLSAVLIDTLHAPLEDRKIAFKRVRMDIIANVFLGGMLDGLVTFKVAIHAKIQFALIGMQKAFAVDVGLDP